MLHLMSSRSKSLNLVALGKLYSPLHRAIKRQRALMHPDRNPGDATAGARFADLQAACKVFDSEDARKDFDETGKVRQIEDLSLRLRALTTGQ